MGRKLYLVTGATGSTGKYTLNELLKNDRHVRAFVHKEDPRSEALQKRGVEIQVGDLLTSSLFEKPLRVYIRGLFCLSYQTRID